MSRQLQTVDVNNFVKGFVTEVSPLTFPEGASLDEENFVLLKNGSRRRRFGMAEEAFSTQRAQIRSVSSDALTNVFEWTSPGGDATRSFLVVQDGKDIRIYDAASPVTTDNLLFTTGAPGLDITLLDRASKVSFSSVSGMLLIASGSPVLWSVSYNTQEDKFKLESFRLKVRDVFGVEDGLSSGDRVSERPEELSDAHNYNLLNQGWGLPRRAGNEEVNKDPIQYFHSIADKYPSNADTVSQALYADVNDSDDRITKRFFPKDLISNPLGNVEAPKGYFIIDPLERSDSRNDAILELFRKYDELDYLNEPRVDHDKTINGATVVSEFAGRAFYAGFDGVLEGGDKRSPRLSSYVMFSRLARNPEDLNRCYSDQDPTSPDSFEALDTDGGFIQLGEAGNILAMASLGPSLVVMADNGMWSITGGSGYGFTATNFKVTKVSDVGILDRRSVVKTDNSLVCWSESGIFVVSPNEMGDLTAQNISANTIQTFYGEIPYNDKVRAVGRYDSFDQTVRWVYSGNKELVLDLNLSAFYKNTIYGPNKVRSLFTVPPYNTINVEIPVTVEGQAVTVGGEVVFVPSAVRQTGFRELKYVSLNPLNEIVFSTFSSPTFKDWGLFDAKAFMVTGYVSGGDFSRYKQVPYLVTHMEQTETGFTSNYDVLGSSSCFMKVAWEWTNSPNSGRWSYPTQIYKINRRYFPQGVDEGYNNGHTIVTTKTKLRGKGRVLSLTFETEPEKDCKLLGWSYVMGVNGNV